ncbi:hypothetical protein A6P39_004970 [Streptomyces sp. FXJ1.172]|uniref:hypothetical protein n=1 Tax=Streptomyces sp. FXJ1.172 TaxID=710705 RepID=UPI0007CFE506|nr:hypothetical protein [Streptomyces sp. FXJ1.172]WEP00503.1 hypothetical protein A6P39_004970 [Streptomyces sp. FXJ1.172]
MRTAEAVAASIKWARTDTLERCINRLKQWRGVATRDVKAATIYLAGLHIAGLRPAWGGMTCEGRS